MFIKYLFTRAQHTLSIFLNNDSAVVAEWSKALSQIQVERMPKVPGSNPAWVCIYMVP